MDKFCRDELSKSCDWIQPTHSGKALLRRRVKHQKNREPLPRTTAGFGGEAIANTGVAFGGALTATGSLGLLPDLLVAPPFADVVTCGEFKEGKLRKAEAAEEGKAEPEEEGG